MAGGRPSAYKPEYSQEVYKLVSVGCLDSQLAQLFDVHTRTISRWMEQYSEFCQSVQEARKFSAEMIESTAFTKCLPYTEIVTRTERINPESGEKEIIIKTERLGDTAMQIMFMKKNDPKWRNQLEEAKRKILEDIQPKLNIDDMSDEEKIARFYEIVKS